jgi:hypothetical protein
MTTDTIDDPCSCDILRVQIETLSVEAAYDRSILGNH